MPRTFSPRSLTLKWTLHVKEKMRHYQLSESRMKRVIRHPDRAEVGVAPHTIAVMQSVTKKMKPSLHAHQRAGGRNPVPIRRDVGSGTGATQEIWVMYQDRGTTRNVITAWRYPGKSPVRDAIPIPEDIRQELLAGNLE